MKGRTKFFYYICNERRKLWILALLCFIGILISLPALLVVERGSPTYYIVILNVVGLGLFDLVVGTVIYGCRRRFGT